MRIAKTINAAADRILNRIIDTDTAQAATAEARTCSCVIPARNTCGSYYRFRCCVGSNCFEAECC